jgi:hypothetical protein
MNNAAESPVNGRSVNLGQLRLQADMMRGQVLAECLRGCGRIVDRATRRRSRA